MTRVDLNADMGESFGPWKMGDDAALLNIVTSANIACGAHAGDPDVMAATMALARDNDVGIGTHPGFSDLQGFGRRRMHVPIASLQNSIRVQVGASLGMARALGTKVRHLKLLIYQIKIYARILHIINEELHVLLNQRMNLLVPSIFLFLDLLIFHYFHYPYI